MGEIKTISEDALYRVQFDKEERKLYVEYAEDSGIAVDLSEAEAMHLDNEFFDGDFDLSVYDENDES